VLAITTCPSSVRRRRAIAAGKKPSIWPFIHHLRSIGEDIAVPRLKAGAHDYLMKGKSGAPGAGGGARVARSGAPDGAPGGPAGAAVRDSELRYRLVVGKPPPTR